MIYTLLLLFGFTHYSSPFSINSCNHGDEDSCIENWACMWCNKTDTNTSSCYKSPICNFDEDIYKDCSYQDKKTYDMVCSISSFLFVILLVMGYYVSMIVIYGTVDRLLMNENVSIKTRRSVNTILIILTLVPLALTFIMEPVYFYFMFFVYLVCGLCTTCCVKIKKKKGEETLSIINNPITNPPIK